MQNLLLKNLKRNNNYNNKRKIIMNTLIIVSLLVIIAGIILRLMEDAPLIDVAIIVIGSVSLFFGLFIIDTPTAMDVYQGKTTLEITYKNGVPVDSVVVFKNKEE